MPRDGSGIYSRPPGTNGVPDTTIESTKYNGFVGDVETDLNAARPIIAGGTGATSASAARTNLGAEARGVQVTNYDTHVFEAGSFWSNVGATGAPDASHHFLGICYVYDGTNAVIEARNLEGATNPGELYVRRKLSGAWGVWVNEGVTSADYVKKAGDTMTGDLTISKDAPALTLNRTATTGPTIVGANGSARWTMHLGYGNANSDFFIDRHNDAGAAAGTPLQISRATGLTTLAALAVNGAISCGNSVSIKDGTQSVVNLQDAAGNNKVLVYYNVSTGRTGFYNLGSAMELAMTSGGVTALGAGFFSRTGLAGAYGADAHNLFWNGTNIKAWVNSSDLGSITLTSDYRIKKDVTDLASTWDAVKALRPVSYTQAQYTPAIEKERMVQEAIEAREKGLDVPATKEGYVPAPMFAADDIERWGFIAHEVQEALLPTAAEGVKDQPDAVQSLNLAPVVASLTKALQEAMARIEALEAAASVPAR